MRAQFFASACCGGMFIPGFGPDNIMGIDDEGSIYDARRDGECPTCGAEDPYMALVCSYPEDMH